MTTVATKASLFGKRYPIPAYCGQCDQVLDGWLEVTVGVGELVDHRWKCPQCGMRVPDELMRPDNPHPSVNTEKENPDVTAIVVHDEPNAALSVDERTDLQQLETVIQTGLQSFFEVGNALMEIRDKRLYRETHKTFEDYCNTRWQFSRTQAYRLIGAAQVVETLSPIGDIPENEAQARPLAQIAPERRAEVWQRAVATAPDGQVTAKHVQQVVDEALGKTGRFENKLWYPVDDRHHLVYRQPADKHNYQLEGALYGCEHRQGTMLNNERRYDAYEFVEAPAYSPPPLPFSSGKGREYGHYPVSEKNKTIYADPRDWGDIPGHYEHCEWISLYDIRRRWNSLVFRYGDFQIVPALPMPVAWLPTARFQPGMYAQCEKCSTQSWVSNNGIAPFAKWKVDGDGIWVCEHGHRTPDAKLEFFDAAAMTASDEDEDDIDEDEEPEEENPVSEEVEHLLTEISHLKDVLAAIREAPELLSDESLTPEILAYYNKELDYWKRPITQEILDAARYLQSWMTLFDQDKPVAAVQAESEE